MKASKISPSSAPSSVLVFLPCNVASSVKHECYAPERFDQPTHLRVVTINDATYCLKAVSGAADPQGEFPMSDIVAGSVVQLKSGGLNMTVKYVEHNEAFCQWFDKTNEKGAKFAIVQLTVV